MKKENIKIGWKILKKGMRSQHNNFKWIKNKWYKHKGEIELYNKGFHASKELVSAINYVTPGIICKVEYKGEVKEQNDKFVASEMRIIETFKFTKRMAVEWSIYCARQSLKQWNIYNKKDKRPLKAIQAAEAWLKKPTSKNKSAARSAAAGAAAAAFAAGSAAAAEAAAKYAVESAVRFAWSARYAESARSAAKIKLHKKLLKIIGATK